LSERSGNSGAGPGLDPAKWLGEYGDFLFNFAFSRLRDREAAEEVVQETFVAGIKGLNQYSGRGAERAWLVGILKRKIVDLIRKRVRRASATGGEEQADISERLFDKRGHWKSDPRIFGKSPDADLRNKEFWTELNDCILALPTKQADVFTMRELEEKSGEEICKELNVTTSNLWVLLHRARLRLATCLKVKWGTAN